VNDELRSFVESFAARLQRRSDECQFRTIDFVERADQADDEEAEALLRRRAGGAAAAALAVWEVREALLAAAREPRVVLPAGSPAALGAGCRCDPKRNRDGRGVVAPTLDGLDVTTGWVFAGDCPLHGGQARS